MNMNPVQREDYQIRGDTECWRTGKGYERTLVLSGWDPDDARRIARVHIRVDQYRDGSYAHGDVWVPATGWQYVTSVPQEEWWDRMPGYTRGQTPLADRLTLGLVDELVARLVEIGI